MIRAAWSTLTDTESFGKDSVDRVTFKECSRTAVTISSLIHMATAPMRSVHAGIWSSQQLLFILG